MQWNHPHTPRGLTPGLLLRLSFLIALSSTLVFPLITSLIKEMSNQYLVGSYVIADENNKDQNKDEKEPIIIDQMGDKIKLIEATVDQEYLDKVFKLGEEYEVKFSLSVEKAIFLSALSEKIPLAKREEYKRKLLEEYIKGEGRPNYKKISKMRVFRVPVKTKWGEEYIFNVVIELGGVGTYFIELYVDNKNKPYEKPEMKGLPWIKWEYFSGNYGSYSEPPPKGAYQIKVGFAYVDIKNSFGDIEREIDGISIYIADVDRGTSEGFEVTGSVVKWTCYKKMDTKLRIIMLLA